MATRQWKYLTELQQYWNMSSITRLSAWAQHLCKGLSNWDHKWGWEERIPRTIIEWEPSMANELTKCGCY